MKITRHPILKASSDTSSAKANITIDLSDELIENIGDLMRSLYKLREHYIPEPAGVLINLNQAYALARDLMNTIDTKKTLDKVVEDMETVMGYPIWIRGRDA